MKQKDFLDGCVRIAQLHPMANYVGSGNDIGVKTGISSFAKSYEYRDEYLIISSSSEDSALYVESPKPLSKVLALIDGVGHIIVLDEDYQYLAEYIRVLNSQIP